jgi:GT2 family glycosyltransferase
MLGFCQRKDVGGVGVKLYFPDETIQHAGIIVGVGGIAGNRFKSIPKDGHGYFANESMIQNLSAVTAACIMNPKAIYEEVGYMNEKLAVAFNDVDFCLKIREKGYLIVYNPYVEFWHYESKSRGQENTPEKIRRFQGEMQTFEERWGDILYYGDPYYNINLSLDTEVYHMKNIEVNYYLDEDPSGKRKKKDKKKRV